MWGVFARDTVTMIYYISLLNVAMVSGLVIMLVSRNNMLHFAGTGMFCIFSWIMSLEFIGDPSTTNVVDGAASIFISLKLKKFKENVVG